MDHGAYVRIQKSFLAANERLLLIVIAKALPRWIVPDHLTALGLFGSLLCCIGFAASGISRGWLWLVAAGLIVNWAGDSLDGSLARVRGIERPKYGFLLDHACDVLSQALIFLGLAASPYVSFGTGCLLLLSYWLATMFTFIRTISVQVFQISYFGIGPTEIRIGLLIYVATLLSAGPLPVATPFGVFSLMDLVAMAIFPVVMVSFVAMTLREARRLRWQERPGKVAKPVAIAMPAGGELSMPHKSFR